MTIPTPDTFADMAVALKLAAGKFKMDVDQLEIVGARIGLSEMGLQLCRAELQKNVDLITAAHMLLKDLVDREPEVRAIAARPKLRLFSRLAAVLA